LLKFANYADHPPYQTRKNNSFSLVIRSLKTLSEWVMLWLIS